MINGIYFIKLHFLHVTCRKFRKISCQISLSNSAYSYSKFCAISFDTPYILIDHFLYDTLF